MEIYLSSLKFKDKPSSEDIRKISATILKDEVDISLQDFADELTKKGRTAVLAKFQYKRLMKGTPIKGQEIVMLDFDNKNEKETYTLADFKNDTFMQNNACFVYRTFSDESSKQDKFRVVFHLDRLVTTNTEIEEIYSKLFEKYPQADSSVGQTSRLFFGSTKGYHLISWENTLNVDSFLGAMDIANIDSNIIIDKETPNYLLLKYKKYGVLKEKLRDEYGKEFPDHIVAGEYFKTLDIQKFLELPEGNPFLDILHEEINPSASIFYEKDLNIYLYKCFSETNKFNGDVLMLLRKYLGLERISEVTDILIKATDSVVNHSSKLGLLKRDATDFRNRMVYKQLEKTHPELYNYYKRYESEIIAVLDVMFDFTYLDKKTGEVKYLNYISVERLASIVSRVTNKKVNKDKMWNILNLIVVTELISKVATLNLPTDILDGLIMKQKEKGTQIRTSTVYEPILNIDKSHEIAKVMKENNVPISGLSYELVYRLFGEEKAFKDFPQAYQPLVEKGIVKMSNDNNNLTSNQENFEKTASLIILDGIKKKGYIFESEVVEALAKKRNITTIGVRKKYVKVRNDIYNKYALNAVRCTKEIHANLSIQSDFTPKTVIYSKK